MTFTLQTELANHLEQEIYTKLLSAATAKAERYNKMWAAREAEGKTFHTKKSYRGEKKICWYSETKGFLTINFFQIPNPTYSSGNDYYRPMSCVVNLEACRTNAQQQREHSVALLEARVNGHLAVTDTVTGNSHKLGKANLIEGVVLGTTKNNKEFKVYTQMMWNYRYGENSANGYLTQYVQFRSDRRGARQEGKTVLQRATEAEIQAKKDAKQAELVAKNEAKWERFKVLPDQIDRWADKQIKKHEKMLTEAGIKKAEETFKSYWYNKNRDFDVKCHKDWVNEELTEARTYKEKVQKFLNNESAVREMFSLTCNTRDDFKARVWRSK